MNNKKLCPKCGSKDIEIEKYMDIDCIVCNSCGYDETAIYEIYPEQKVSQKAKGRFAPYKAGGGKRVMK